MDTTIKLSTLLLFLLPILGLAAGRQLKLSRAEAAKIDAMTPEAAARRSTDGNTRQALTYAIVAMAALGLVALGVTAIHVTETKDRLEMTRYVFTALVPLMASWVGTVVAYYYSRENLQAATSSVEKLAKVAGIEKLKGISVTLKMIPRSTISTIVLAELQTKLLKEVIKFLEDEKKQRLPVFEADGRPKYIIHASAIHTFISRTSLAGKPTDKLTFKDLTDDADLRKLFEESFALVGKSDSLADAKLRMAKETTKREDVFVTENGSANEPVLGWLTDNMIAEVAKL